jgi:hypothetical protein
MSVTRAIFETLTHSSIKLASYFAVYDRLLAPYRGKPITIVEIGVKDGGGLELWRKYFGDQARIIGIDLTHAAAEMRAEGFEIYIGDQADPNFWRQFFTEVGPIDILLDDGGHTNKQQITTIECALPFIRDGGLILTEDTDTSYNEYYGNPSRYSFVNYCKALADRQRHADTIFSVSFFTSIVALHIDRRLCIPPNHVHVNGLQLTNENQWNIDKRIIGYETGRKGRALLGTLPGWVQRSVTAAYTWLTLFVAKQRFRRENLSLRKFFR